MASEEMRPTPSDLWTRIQALEARFDQETAALRSDLERHRFEKQVLTRKLAALEGRAQGQRMSRAGLLKAAGAAAAGLAGTTVIGTRTDAFAATPSPPSGLTSMITPVRVLDTRIGLGASGPIPSGGTITLTLANANGIPADAIGVIANLTAVTPTDQGYLSIYPGGTQWPGTSSINFVPNENAIANAVIVGLGTGTTSPPAGSATILVAVANNGKAHVLLDLFGYIE